MHRQPRSHVEIRRARVAVVLVALVVSLIGICGPMAGHRSVVAMAVGSAATVTESTPRPALGPAGGDSVSAHTADSLPTATVVRGIHPQRCGGPAGHVDADVSAIAPAPRGDFAVTALRAAVAAPFGIPPGAVAVHACDRERPPPAPHLSTVLRI